jgi:hypothetical protein
MNTLRSFDFSEEGGVVELAVINALTVRHRLSDAGVRFGYCRKKGTQAFR